MDIDKLEGRELNTKMAELMGWMVAHDRIDGRNFYLPPGVDPDSYPFDYYVDEWQPSRDIAAAMQVMEKMRERGIYITIVPQKDDYLIAVSEYHSQFNSYSHLLDLHANTVELLPEAICRAALKAVEDK